MPANTRSRSTRTIPREGSNSAASIGTAEIRNRHCSFDDEQWSSFRIMNSRPDFGASCRFRCKCAWWPGGGPAGLPLLHHAWGHNQAGLFTSVPCAMSRMRQGGHGDG